LLNTVLIVFYPYNRASILTKVGASLDILGSEDSSLAGQERAWSNNQVLGRPSFSSEAVIGRRDQERLLSGKKRVLLLECCNHLPGNSCGLILSIPDGTLLN
jgi:hypothetical protein